MSANNTKAKASERTKSSGNKVDSSILRSILGLNAHRGVSTPKRPNNKPKRPDRAGPLKGGSVERRIERIKYLFDKAEGSYRKRIDIQIINCFEMADYLWSIRADCANVLDGAFKRRIERRPNKGEALRFVLSKVRTDAKEGSLYYRATEPLFLQGLTLPKLSKAVTAAGGYRALANQHVKFPRGPKPSGDDAQSDSSDTSDENEIEDPADDEGKNNNKTKEHQREYSTVSALKGTEVIHCKFDGNGRDMMKPKAGGWFGVCGHILEVVDGRPIFEFCSYTSFE